MLQAMKVITFRPDHMLSFLWEHAHSLIPKLHCAAQVLCDRARTKSLAATVHAQKSLCSEWNKHASAIFQGLMGSFNNNYFLEKDHAMNI